MKPARQNSRTVWPAPAGTERGLLITRAGRVGLKMNQETGSKCGSYFLPLTLINEQTDQEISSRLLTCFGGALATCQALLTFYGSNLGPHITAHDGTVMTDFLPSFLPPDFHLCFQKPHFQAVPGQCQGREVC